VPLRVLRGDAPPGDRWTEHDYTSAVALTLYEAGLCDGCGHPLTESTSPHADPNDLDRTHHYTAPPPTRCHACTAAEMTAAAYTKASWPRALRFRADRIDDRADDAEE